MEGVVVKEEHLPTLDEKTTTQDFMTMLYLDGTSLDNTRILPASSTDGWVDG
jgi:hypothetical protein